VIVIAALQAAPTWDRNTQSDTAAGLEANEPGRVVQQLDRGRTPDTAGPARVGFQGIRKELERIVSTWSPGVPRTPAKVIAHRSRPNPAGRPAVQPIRAAVVPVALVSNEQTAPWYELLQ
jgi:hypothetical protein